MDHPSARHRCRTQARRRRLHGKAARRYDNRISHAVPIGMQHLHAALPQAAEDIAPRVHRSATVMALLTGIVSRPVFGPVPAVLVLWVAGRGARGGRVRRRRRQVVLGLGLRAGAAGAGITGRWTGDGFAAGSPAPPSAGVARRTGAGTIGDTGADVCLRRRRHGPGRRKRAAAGDWVRTVSGDPRPAAGPGRARPPGDSAGRVVGTGGRVPRMPGPARA